MSSNNNSSPEAMAGMLVLAVIAFAIMVVAALFAFAAIVLTGFAIAAWNEPVTLLGDTFEPEAARAYVGRGLVGAAVAPVFVIFCSAFFQFNLNEITEHGWYIIILGGYSLGSLGIEMAIQQQREEAEAAAALSQEILPPLPAPQAKPPQVQPAKPSQEFGFARWDDEEIIQ